MQKREADSKRARISGSYTCTSLNSRLESKEEDEEGRAQARRDSHAGLPFSTFEFWIPGSRFGVAGCGLRVSDFRCRFSGVGCRVLGFGCRVSGVGFRVSGLGFRVSGVGCRV